MKDHDKQWRKQQEYEQAKQRKQTKIKITMINNGVHIEHKGEIGFYPMLFLALECIERSIMQALDCDKHMLQRMQTRKQTPQELIAPKMNELDLPRILKSETQEFFLTCTAVKSSTQPTINAAPCMPVCKCDNRDAKIDSGMNCDCNICTSRDAIKEEVNCAIERKRKKARHNDVSITKEPKNPCDVFRDDAEGSADEKVIKKPIQSSIIKKDKNKIKNIEKKNELYHIDNTEMCVLYKTIKTFADKDKKNTANAMTENSTNEELKEEIEEISSACIDVANVLLCRFHKVCISLSKEFEDSD